MIKKISLQEKDQQVQCFADLTPSLKKDEFAKLFEGRPIMKLCFGCAIEFYALFTPKPAIYHLEIKILPCDSNVLCKMCFSEISEQTSLAELNDVIESEIHKYLTKRNNQAMLHFITMMAANPEEESTQ